MVLVQLRLAHLTRTALFIDALLECLCVVKQGRDSVPVEYSALECVDGLR
jgi:hypothetical protein